MALLRVPGDWHEDHSAGGDLAYRALTFLLAARSGRELAFFQPGLTAQGAAWWTKPG